MNKNGFTLIELVSVVAILSIIGVLMLPKINTAFKESRADQLEEVREKVVNATDVYLKYSCGKDSYNLLMKNDEVKIGLNTNLSATVFMPNSEEDYISLIMPVQIR